MRTKLFTEKRLHVDAEAMDANAATPIWELSYNHGSMSLKATRGKENPQAKWILIQPDSAPTNWEEALDRARLAAYDLQILEKHTEEWQSKVETLEYNLAFPTNAAKG